jgi:heterodisulfide reductase subunit C
VEITDILIIMRNMAVKKGYMADQHKKIGASMMKTATTVPLSAENSALREKMGLPAVPPMAISDPKYLEEFRTIMRKTGFDKLVGGA